MSRRELRSLDELGSTSCAVHHRLRSRQWRGSLSDMEGNGQVEAGEISDLHASDVRELREKLQMAQEELELARADFARQFEQVQQNATEERARLAEQLRQAQRMAEAAKEEGEEQTCEAQEAERQRNGQAKENEDLRQRLQEAEEKTRTEVDAVRLRLDLEGLRHVEEVRKQFDERYVKFGGERDWYRREHDRDLALIADERPSDGTGQSHEPEPVCPDRCPTATRSSLRL